MFSYPVCIPYAHPINCAVFVNHTLTPSLIIHRGQKELSCSCLHTIARQQDAAVGTSAPASYLQASCVFDLDMLNLHHWRTPKGDRLIQVKHVQVKRQRMLGDTKQVQSALHLDLIMLKCNQQVFKYLPPWT